MAHHLARRLAHSSIVNVGELARDLGAIDVSFPVKSRVRGDVPLLPKSLFGLHVEH
jgi:hypothetical protein